MAFDAPELTHGFYQLGLAADAVITAGDLVAINASGNALVADDTAGLVVIGRAEEDADNTGGSAGDVTVLVKPGIFKYDNDGDNPVTIASLGGVCYAHGSNAVAVVAGVSNNVIAGTPVRIETDGVYVDTRYAAALAALLALATA